MEFSEGPHSSQIATICLEPSVCTISAELSMALCMNDHTALKPLIVYGRNLFLFCLKDEELKVREVKDQLEGS